MRNITLLAELTCLTNLVNNKVVVIDTSDNSYRMYNPGRYCSIIPKEFNPEDYALLETDSYAVIIDATPKMREKYLVNKLWIEQCTNKLLKHRDLKKQDLGVNYEIGDKVHLKDKHGIYTIHNIIDDIFGKTYQLTCGTWQHTDRPIRSYDAACIKCHAGNTKYKY